MYLHTLRPKFKSKKRRRVGRGGKRGTYSGRGMKGQKARTGYRRRPYFEGGRTSLIKQLPKKKGFKSIFTKPEIVNLEDLDRRFKNNDKIDKKKLLEADLIDSAKSKVKILGKGKITKKLHIIADAFSKSAEEKIKKSGGSISRIQNRSKR